MVKKRLFFIEYQFIKSVFSTIVETVVKRIYDVKQKDGF